MLLFHLPSAMHHEFLCFDLYWCLLFQSLWSWLQDHISSPHSRRCQLWQTMGLILHHLHQDLETLVVPSQEVPAFLLQMGLLGTPRKRPWLINHAICSSFSFFLWHCPCGCGFLCRVLLAVFVLNGEGLIGARWNLNEDCSSLSSSVSGETCGMILLSADFVYEEATPKFRIHPSRQGSEGSSSTR